MKSIIFFFAILASLVASPYPIKSINGANHISFSNSSEDGQDLYVMDGIVAWWDGEWNVAEGVHDSSSPIWVDLIGGREMPTTLPSLSWENDALARNGIDGFTYDSGIDFSDPLSERTFEIVISYDSDYIDTSSNYFIMRMNEIGTWINFWNRLKLGIALYAGGGIVETPFEQPTFKGSVSLVGTSKPYVINPSSRHYACYYANGILVNNTSSFGGGSTSSMKIELFAAARNWPSPNTIKVHCIRIYDKALSDAQVYYNYTIDKKRFNLQ